VWKIRSSFHVVYLTHVNKCPKKDVNKDTKAKKEQKSRVDITPAASAFTKHVLTEWPGRTEEMKINIEVLDVNRQPDYIFPNGEKPLPKPKAILNKRKSSDNIAIPSPAEKRKKNRAKL